MKILYLSALSSERLIADIHKKTGKNPGFAIQKFSRLLLEGFISNNVETTAFSVVPYPYDIYKRLILKDDTEVENGVTYKYVPQVRIPLLSSLWIVIYTFFYTLIWGIRNKNDKAIVCDVLKLSLCLGALFATKINRTKCVGVVTDMPNIILTSKKVTLRERIVSCINMSFLTSFTHYVLLTEQMNEVVNPHNRPYVIMEGLCENSCLCSSNSRSLNNGQRTMLFAGGVNERNGVETLVKAFIKSQVDAKLIIYGDGEFANDLKAICKSHPGIDYRGSALNEEVVEEEYKASVLVNPRFSDQEFTKFSFPSKNIEYMASGTPLLATKLPGIPNEYYKYMFLLENESVDGYAESIKYVFSLTDDYLRLFGEAAQRFVLLEKNNVVQAKKIVEIISK